MNNIFQVETNTKKKNVQNIPDVIGSLSPALIRLSLNGNKISSISQEIGKLVKLEKLELQNNAIKKLPDTIGNLNKLEELNLSGNKSVS